MTEKQTTLGNEVSLRGIALHTGSRAVLKMKPALPNSGIIFQRIDLPGQPQVKALAHNVIDVRRGTTIANGAGKVHTVEHVLSAFHGLGIDNAIVEMDGPEPPIADGSSDSYVKMIQDAGIVELDSDIKYFTIKESVAINEGETKIEIHPHHCLKITCKVAYGVSALDKQEFSGEITPQFFAEQISPARTFCLYKELEQLIRMGLVKGGSLDNAAVIHDGAIICKEELRFPNELVRHKVLDIIGDIFLLGRRVKAHIIASRPGHPTNVMLVQKILKEQKGD
ncbi:MAG TPA: UDP-3-O-acyl-N-acetylglucosamine deacetylase [Victivallales bacterium]|nr:UDP-3-O-acyl-N-acetylglucosamine deacetylase [Victivallales bacterium]HPO89964.1 UDP-3-O-acyl-N-acetylglucosamine deacetylase [Victivallales bacterium]HRR05726.1 UDP-3-O-acyl-N-acetylglucosamine deacetylase [Victivallales bacterium]HRR29532.1 UDP-3-O-acyl-N-acetylglucosamine deacetylase [Victivallales bacterium]HRU01320.1 UDP-3-O-acyl-N-acetylglucosamine deacetylase [Victivallales bacterium]